MSPEKRYHRLGAFILIAGLLAATAVYLRTSPSDDSGAPGYEVEGGNAYAVRPDDSKRYERQMEEMSGKSGVLAAEFMDWFESLWHGRNLAYTLGVLSVGGSLACLFLAHFQLLAPPDDPIVRKDP